MKVENLLENNIQNINQDNLEELNEARQGLILYCYVKLRDLVTILETNYMETEGMIFSRSKSDLINYIKSNFGYVSPLASIITLDGEVLSWNYKIKPISLNGDRSASVEVIDRDINNINRYIKEIALSNAMINDTGSYIWLDVYRDESEPLSGRDYFDKYIDIYPEFDELEIFSYYDLCKYIKRKNFSITEFTCSDTNEKPEQE